MTATYEKPIGAVLPWFSIDAKSDINDLEKRERQKNVDDYFDWENEFLNG